MMVVGGAKGQLLCSICFFFSKVFSGCCKHNGGEREGERIGKVLIEPGGYSVFVEDKPEVVSVIITTMLKSGGCGWLGDMENCCWLVAAAAAEGGHQQCGFQCRLRQRNREK